MDTSTARLEGIPATVVETAIVDPAVCAVPSPDGDSSLEGVALEAWRSYLQSHATIVRLLDAELISEHGITTRDYEVLLYLAQSPDRRLPMSALAESTMLTRSGITRLVDGLVAGGFIERVSCPKRRTRLLRAADRRRLRQAPRRRLHARGQHPPAVPRALRRRRDRPTRRAARASPRRPARRLLHGE